MIFQKILEEQAKTKNEEGTEKVIKVLKEKPEMMRDTVEKKKSVVMVGINEEFMAIRQVREKKERKTVEQLIEAIQEKDHELVGKIEEVFRLRKYDVGIQRLVEIRFRSQAAAEEVVRKA